MTTTLKQKPTLATLKSFVKQNADRLLVKCCSSFDGMTDCCETNHNAAFRPARQHDDTGKPFRVIGINENTLGISGVWLVGGSRDYVRPYTAGGIIGYEVYNSCGNFIVGVQQ